MTSLEIIERLLDERKISAKEAIVLLRDLAKIGVCDLLGKVVPEEPQTQVVTCYGVISTPYTNTATDATTISCSVNDLQPH